ncbi:MAG: hypothetical protein M3N19_06355, partial [Candidatus Eremiobacteraeota bacterium]|nr:hypothetical protein [Candidatus Eremiobacteraeota bacterium]
MHLRLLTAVLVTVFLTACGAATNGPTALPTTAPTASSSGTLSISTGAQTVPTVGGATATVSIAAATGTPTGATLAVTASTTPPSGIIALAGMGRQTRATTRVPLMYLTFVPSADIQLTTFPAFTISFPSSLLPAGSTIHEAFLDASSQQPVYTLDIAFGANSATLTSTASAPKLLAAKTYIFAFYYELGGALSPSPSPSPSPSASAMPTATPSTSPTATPTATPTASPTPTPTPTSSGFLTPVTSVTETAFASDSVATGVQTVAVGADGKIYFADAGHFSVQRIDPALGIVTYPQQYNDGGSMVNVGPTSVAKGRDGRMWFTTSNNYLLALDQGAFSQVYKRAGAPALNAIVGHSDGNLWAIGSTAVAMITTSGSETDFTLPANPDRQRCNAITSGPDGNLWYTCSPNI